MMKLSFELISAIIDVIRITTSGAVNWFSVWKITFLESTSDNGLDIGILFLCKFFLVGVNSRRRGSLPLVVDYLSKLNSGILKQLIAGDILLENICIWNPDLVDIVRSFIIFLHIPYLNRLSVLASKLLTMLHIRLGSNVTVLYRWSDKAITLMLQSMTF